jgi:hypothetical protein
MKTWILKIEACGPSRIDTQIQLSRLMAMGMNESQGLYFTVSNMNGSAVAIWTEGPEIEDDNHL